ncbi:hypothetical protein DL98DRAFT_440850 [Cadophora sp. DSE1049]|nr:hypothetical protein DL98DRAFT_440850 [Cadophora sp. DSE1049]
MCDYTKVNFRCGHRRYIVRAWCKSYEVTHKKCPPKVKATEFRYRNVLPITRVVNIHNLHRWDHRCGPYMCQSLDKAC